MKVNLHTHTTRCYHAAGADEEPDFSGFRMKKKYVIITNQKKRERVNEYASPCVIHRLDRRSG